jgi:hypothetical protein
VVEEASGNARYEKWENEVKSVEQAKEESPVWMMMWEARVIRKM